MIIQALNEQYERLKNMPDEDIPLLGFSREKIHFEFVLSEKGELLQINDLRNEKKAAKSIVVPQVVKRASNIASNFLCDNTGYVLGRDSEEKEQMAKDPKRGLETFLAFKELHHKIGDVVDDMGMKAVLVFMDSWHPEKLQETLCGEKWGELGGSKIVFRLDGQNQFIHDRPAVKEAWSKYSSGKQTEYEAFCLVTGKKKGIARLHNSIKGVKDAQSVGADIVSFNRDSFCSYNKEKGFNAPISEEAMFNYTTVLNHMLRKESRRKIQIGDATTVFWAAGETPLTGFLKDILDPRENTPDISGLRSFLETISAGKKPAELLGTENLKFYILGLSPNAKRLSIRFWHESTVEDISRKIGQHFSDLCIKREFENQPEFPGMWQLLHEMAPEKEIDKLSQLKNPGSAGDSCDL